jgi:hypothetical protein
LNDHSLSVRGEKTVNTNTIKKFANGLVCLAFLAFAAFHAYDFYLRYVASKAWKRKDRARIKSEHETNDFLAESGDRGVLVRRWEDELSQAEKYTPRSSPAANRPGNAYAIMGEPGKAHHLLDNAKSCLTSHLGPTHTDVATVDDSLQFVDLALLGDLFDRNAKIADQASKPQDESP